tara:strand:- start:1192 stop:2088 length:897 start_codon:yes stop_codon:yes gene_type:complete
MSYIGKEPVVGNFQVCDAISVVNGQAAYSLTVGGAAVNPESESHMLVSLNGVLQKPGSSFTISGSTITFASNLATGDVIDFVQILGNVLDLGVPSDGTVTTAKLAADAVTEAKIADDAVESEHLNNNIISGQTALGAEPADTDEFLVSDAGTIKRVDYSYIKGGGILVGLQYGADTSPSGTTSTTSSSYQDTGVSFTYTPAASGNKVWLNWDIVGSMGGGTGYYKVVRTVGGSDTDVVAKSIGSSKSRDSDYTLNFNFWYEDSPSTTSEITYKLHMRGSHPHAIYIEEAALFLMETSS